MLCQALLKLKIECLYLHVYEKLACMQKISLLAQKLKKLGFFSAQKLKFALTGILKIEKLSTYLHRHVCEKQACMHNISLLAQKLKKLIFSLHKS